MTESEDPRSSKHKVHWQELVMQTIMQSLRRYVKRGLKEFEKEADEIRRRVIKVIDEAIAEMRKKVTSHSGIQHDDPSPPSSPSNSTDDSCESIPCGSFQQATAWFDDERGLDEGEILCYSVGDNSENVTCDSRAYEDVMTLVQDSSPQACTSPPAPPSENSSGNDAATIYTGMNEDYNHSHLTQAVPLQYAPSETTLSRDKEHTPAVKRLSIKAEHNYAVNYGCKHLPVIHNDKLHLMVQNSTNENDMLRTYNLLAMDSREFEKGQEINLTSKNIQSATCYKIFYFVNKISLLTGRVDYKTWRLNLYHLVLDTNPAKCASWEKVPFSRFSISDSLFDLNNCIPVSHREDRVIVVSTVKDCILFHIFSQKTSGRNWKTASSLLEFTSNQIQSCIDQESKFIYCSLLGHKTGAYIYKFDLVLLEQHQKCSSGSIKSVCHWHIEEPTIQNCFLSLLQEEIIMISFNSINDKNIMKVKRSENFLSASPADYEFEFSHERIIAASIVSNSKIVIIYQDNKTKQYFIKTFTIAN